MQNIFEVGGQVSGESFIGRKAEIEKFRNEFLNSKKRKVYSVIGLARSGKTSFVKKIFENLPDNIFYHYEDISLSTSYYSIWLNICLSLRDYIENMEEFPPEHEKYIIKVQKLVSEIVDVDTEPQLEKGGLIWDRFCRRIIDVFKTLKKALVPVILVFDEFDRAQSIFSLGTSQFMLFRTLFADGDINVSSICISRRKIETIEGKIYQSSTLANVMNFYPFKGFNNADMSEYYSILSNKYKIHIDDHCKERIEFYAGNLPFLLSIIGHEIVDSVEHGVVDIDDIYSSKCHAIVNYYHDCIEQLKRDGYINKIIPFVIGPKMGVGPNDEQILSNLGYLKIDQKGRYLCICSKFSSELASYTRMYPIWDNIINLEIRLKNLLMYRAPQIALDLNIKKNTVNDAEREILAQVLSGRSTQWGTLNNFVKDGKSYFSVMSCSLTVRLIAKFWDDYFKMYFRNRNYSEYEHKFKKCTDARNPIAHGHQDYLSDADINEVNSYCEEFFTILSEKFPQSTHIPNEKTLIWATLQKWNNSEEKYKF